MRCCLEIGCEAVCKIGCEVVCEFDFELGCEVGQDCGIWLQVATVHAREKSLTQQDFQLLALFHSKAKAKTALTRLG